MPSNSEVTRIVDFVRLQHGRTRSKRRFKRRLAAFGFTIENTDKGPMIALLPWHRIVCPLPAEISA